MKYFFAFVCLLLVGCSPTCPFNCCTPPKAEPAVVNLSTVDVVVPDEIDKVVDGSIPTSVVGNDEPTAPVSEPAEEKAWIPLFDGESLAGWAVPVYGGDGTVEVQEGNLVLGRGERMTGIRYEKEFPKIDYEIQYEARRTEGYDFFAACTFPVNDSFCTFVNGGWSSGTIGLSSINGYDASENSSSSHYGFKESVWYRFRISVTSNSIKVWITPQDKEGNWETETIHVDFTMEEETTLSTRMEMNLYKPLGFCTWSTEGQLRNILYRSH